MHTLPTRTHQPTGKASSKIKTIFRRKTLVAIHKTLGLFGSIIIMVMSITGLILNHKSTIGYSSATSMKMQEFIFALHSGSMGNTNLVWLTDFGAICMLVLSVSGIWMWVGMFINKRKRGK